MSAGGPGAAAKRSSARAVGCGCVPVIVVLVVLGIIGYVVFQVSDVADQGSKAYQDLTDQDANVMALSGSTTVLGGGGDGGKVDLVAVVQDNSSSPLKRYLARLEMGPGGVEQRWRGPLLDDQASTAEVAVVGDTLFAGVKDELYAVDADTGATRWKATLDDEVTSGCADCFAAVGGALVVRTTDATVAAFTGGSAEPLWSRRLTSPQGTTTIAADTLIITDDDPKTDDGDNVTTVDPSTGKVLRAVDPTCPADEDGFGGLNMGAGLQVHTVPGSGDVVAAFGFGDGCVVRWDPASGKVRFATRVPDAGSVDEGTVLVGAQDLVFGGNGSELFRVGLADGKVTPLDVPSELDPTPSRILGRTLVADTTTTRGTARGGLAGWDLDTGASTWTVKSPMGAEPVSTSEYYRASDALFDDSPLSLLVTVAKELRLFVFDGESRSVTVFSVDPATGDVDEVSQRKLVTRYDSGTPSLTIEWVGSTTLLFTLEQLLQVTPLSGEGSFTTFPKVD